jgi:(p)ppGpp synthase/HD superfamily hydrolase
MNPLSANYYVNKYEAEAYANEENPEYWKNYTKDSIKKYFKKYGVITESVNTNDDTKARIAKLYIKGEDSMGILMHILKIICDEHKINIRDLHVTSDGPFFHCEIELVIYKQKVVSQTCMKLRELPNVTAVNIVEIN